MPPPAPVNSVEGEWFKIGSIVALSALTTITAWLNRRSKRRDRLLADQLVAPDDGARLWQQIGKILERQETAEHERRAILTKLEGLKCSAGGPCPWDGKTERRKRPRTHAK